MILYLIMRQIYFELEIEDGLKCVLIYQFVKRIIIFEFKLTKLMKIISTLTLMNLLHAMKLERISWYM
jgi:hypothetical protein